MTTRLRTLAVVLLAAQLALGGGAVGAVAHVRGVQADERRAREAVAQARDAYRDGVLAVMADVEKVLDPVLTADAYDSPVADEIRADVYRYGDTERELGDVRAAFDRLDPAPARWQHVHDALATQLTEIRDAVVSLESFDLTPVDWAPVVSRVTAAREQVRAVLRDEVLDPGAQLPSSASSTLATTRAASVLHYDSACETAFQREPLPSEPGSPQEALRQLEELTTSQWLAVSALAGVDVPGYEGGWAETHVRLPAEDLWERSEAQIAELKAAVGAQDGRRIERALGVLDELDDVAQRVGQAVVDYGATVCAAYFDIEVPGSVLAEQDDDTATT